jgi:carbon monoxide dehydrogenase subunit G
MAEKSQVTVSDTIAAPVADVWRLASDFGGFADIMDGIESCETEGEGVGMLRKMGAGDGHVVERLEELDDATHHLAYSIVSGPVPMRDYWSTIDLREVDEGTAIEWSSTFEPVGVPAEKAERLATRIYEAGIAGIKKALGVN